ncbi:MAG: lipopolysaccharide heptosyltransferase I [Selenomonadales bacterium]|nr:lipopolysaccharide heptosyltransferase I [Selenomonadales bacterium]
MSVKNILIIKLSAIGDVIHALPVSHAIKETYPDAHITWVVEPPAYSLLTNNPYIDEIILFRKKEFKSWKGFRKNFPDFYAKLREKEYDVVLDLQGLGKSGIIALLARGKHKLGTCDMRELSGLISKPTAGENAKGHIVERYLDAARAIGCRVENVVFPIYPTEEEEANARRYLQEGRIKGDYVVIAVGTNWPNKCWPIEHIARLADLLYIMGIKPVLVGGGKEDEKRAKEIHKKMRSTATNLVGKTSLKELAAIIRGARAFVGGDTGPTHMAAGLGVPAIEIMGPTDANRNGPYGQSQNAIEIGADCKHCWKRKCRKGIDCLEEITPQQVLEKLNPYLPE